MQKLFRIAAISSVMLGAVAANAASGLEEAAPAAAGAGVIAAADQRATAFMEAFKVEIGMNFVKRESEKIDDYDYIHQALITSRNCSDQLKQRAADLGFYILQYSGSGYEMSSIAGTLQHIVDHNGIRRIIRSLDELLAIYQPRDAKRGHVRFLENAKTDLMRQLSPDIAVGAAEGFGGAAAGAGHRESDSE